MSGAPAGRDDDAARRLTEGVPRSAIPVSEALASDDLRIRVMATILDQLTWLVPMHIAMFYTVNEEGEKYASDPIVAKVSDAFPLTADEGLATYATLHRSRDPFAPCRLPDRAINIATLRDVPEATWYAEGLAKKFEILPAANVYFREGDRIVAGLSLVRRLRAPRLSPSEMATLQRCHGWFEFWYSLGARQHAPVAPYAADPRFTRRERDVLAQLVSGKSYETIAEELEISYTTLKTHVKHILRKLGAHNRAEAMAEVLGGVTPPKAD
jgi:DNA-binding CsgD family transcriptional regulator